MPIVHAAADLGSLAGAVRREHERRFGTAAADRHAADVAQLWKNVRTAIDKLALKPANLRLYQDGLPDDGPLDLIVKQLADAGSFNHRILLELTARGAALTGTESPDLLKEELALAQRAMAGGPPPDPAVARDLLDRRDRFIAGRIAATLEPEKTGLLFLGALHSFAGELPPDVAVSRLTYPVPAGFARP